MIQTEMRGGYRASTIDRLAIFKPAVIVIGLCLLAFIALKATAASGVSYDEVVLHATNVAWAGMPFGAVQRVLMENDLPELILVFALVCAWSAPRLGSLDRTVLRRRVLLAVLAFEPTYALTRFIQAHGSEPRPASIVALVPLFGPVNWQRSADTFQGYSSFPSDHAALSAIAAVVAFSIGRRYGWFFVALGLYVNAYRIAYGLHWPSDVVGGILIGTCVAAGLLLVRPWLRRPFNSVLATFDRYPAVATGVAVLFLSEFGHGFGRVQAVLHGLGHGRLFH